MERIIRWVNVFERLRYHGSFCEKHWKLVGEISRPFVEDCGQGLHQRWSITGMTWMDPFDLRIGGLKS